MNAGNAPIGIIGAMKSEVNKILSELENEQKISLSGLVFHSGLFQGVPCVISQCGAGKVNAAVYAQAMIMRFSPRLIINIGVAGGIAPGIGIGDLVVATACVQHDFDVSALGASKGEIVIYDKAITEIPCDPKVAERMADSARDIYGTVHTGIIVTGDTFVADNALCSALHQQYNALACEMEGGSIAQVCYMNNVPVAVFRSISDNGNDAANMDFLTFEKQSAEKSQSLMRTVLPVLYTIINT